MNQQELEQEVTDHLLTALELQNYPSGAMVYCRKAIECIVHNKHFQETGLFPIEENGKSFPSIISITEKLNKMVGKQSRLIIGSINAQSRGSLHWDFETRGNAADFDDVKLVIEQIKSVYFKFFNNKISLEGLKITDMEFRNNIKIIVDEGLTEEGITQDIIPHEENVDIEKLDTILNLAEIAIQKGAEFSPLESFLLGNAAYRAGELDIAEGYYMQIKNISERSEGLSSSLSDALNNLGNLSLQKKDFQGAEKFYKESLSIRIKLGDKLGEANAYNNLGNLYFEKNNFKNAEKYFSKSLEIYELLEDVEGRGISFHNLGRLYSKFNDVEQAEKLYKSSLELKRLLGDEEAEALTLNNLGILALDNKDFEKAEKLLLKSLAIVQKIDDRIAEALLMKNLGLLSKEKGELNKALKFYEVSLNIYTQIGLKSEIAGCLRNIAVIYFTEGKREEAEKRFRQNLIIVKELKEIKSIAFTLNNLGEIERERKNYDEAKKLFLESLFIKEHNNDIPGLPNTYNNLAQVFYEQKDIVAAKRLFNQSLENNMQYQDYPTTKKRLEGTDRRDAKHALNCLSEIAIIEGDINKMKELVKKTYLLIEGLDENFDDDDYEKIIEIFKSNMETAWI